MSISLGELAVQFGCELRGDPEVRVSTIAALGAARPGSLSFLANPRLRRQLADTQASAVVLDAKSAAQCPAAALIARNPHATFARIAAVLHPQEPVAAGVHPSAVVSAQAQVDPSAHVGPQAVVEAGSIIGARSYIGAGCFIGTRVRIGADCRLVGRVTLLSGVQLGARALIWPGAVIGGDGFGFAREQARWLKVPQLGGVRIGEDVEIGANTTIDRGAIEDTVIEEGVKLDNLIQVAHNVHIGAHTAIAACTGISGSAHIGQRCMIGGGVGFAGHISICDDVIITGMAMVTRSIRVPGMYSSGIPTEPSRLWRRMVGRLKLLAKRDAAALASDVTSAQQDETDE